MFFFYFFFVFITVPISEMPELSSTNPWNYTTPKPLISRLPNARTRGQPFPVQPSNRVIPIKFEGHFSNLVNPSPRTRLSNYIHSGMACRVGKALHFPKTQKNSDSCSLSLSRQFSCSNPPYLIHPLSLSLSSPKLKTKEKKNFLSLFLAHKFIITSSFSSH
jgi:hypothetical protein